MPTGALLVTGPTGSGKSTTLYGCLALINRPEINVITVEDPVEYRLAGVNQVQINVRAGLTFASALRSILRSDPDVVMVGEIRDAETAKISIEAALTGHFVLSTLHTNDAPSTITRLGEMGVEPFLTGAAVSAVLAQRLARKLCTHCCEAYQPTEAELTELRVAPEMLGALDGTAFYRKKGCPRCNHTGYKGRVGVFQFLRMTEEIAALAVQHASRDEIARAAAASGMRSLWDDGLEKVASGLTSLEELARVLVLGANRSAARRCGVREPALRGAAQQLASRRRLRGGDFAAERDERLDRMCDEARCLDRVGKVYGPAGTGVALGRSARPRPRRRSVRPRRRREAGRPSGRRCARGGRRARARPAAGARASLIDAPARPPGRSSPASVTENVATTISGPLDDREPRAREDAGLRDEPATPRLVRVR